MLKTSLKSSGSDEKTKIRAQATKKVLRMSDQKPLKDNVTISTNMKLRKPGLLLNLEACASTKNLTNKKLESFLNGRRSLASLYNRGLCGRKDNQINDLDNLSMNDGHNSFRGLPKKPHTTKNAQTKGIVFEESKELPINFSAKVQQPIPINQIKANSSTVTGHLKRPDLSSLIIDETNMDEKVWMPRTKKKVQFLNNGSILINTNSKMSELDYAPISKLPSTAPDAIGRARELFTSANYTSTKKATPKSKLRQEVVRVLKPAQLRKPTRDRTAKSLRHHIKIFELKSCKNNSRKDDRSSRDLDTNPSQLNPRLGYDTYKNLTSHKIESNGKIDKTVSLKALPITRPIKTNRLVCFEHIQDWKTLCKKMGDLEALLYEFFDAINKEHGLDDVIRRYVQFVQDGSLHEIPSIVTHKRFSQAARESIILEGWSIFSVYYICAEKAQSNKKRLISKVAISIYQNLIFIFKLIQLEITQDNHPEADSALQELIERSALPKNRDFITSMIGMSELLLRIERSNTSLKDFLEDVAEISCSEVSYGISQLLRTLRYSKIDESISYLFDVFNDYLPNKLTSVVQHLNQHTTDDSSDSYINPPYIPIAANRSKEYTLILDLDETLVHCTHSSLGGQVLLRPYLDRFLDEMAKYYEIVIFTAAQQDYADWIIDRFDKGGRISHRLYRQHTYNLQNANIKDLDKVGRDLKKTIIIDNMAENFYLHTENGICVSSWFDDPEDTTLLQLIPNLRG